MKFVLTSLFLILAMQIFAQRVSLEDLYDVQRASEVDVEDILFNMGFVHEPSGKIGELESYSFRKNLGDSEHYMNITKNVYKGMLISTTFFTLYRTDYNKIKNDLKAHNFKYIETVKEGNATTHYYENGDTEVSLDVNYNDDDKYYSYFISMKSISGFRFYLNTIGKLK